MPRRVRIPRSPLALLLLLLLYETPAPTFILASVLGVPSRTVSKYLSRLRQRGLVRQDEYGLWQLTEKGLRMAEEIRDLRVIPADKKELARRLGLDCAATA